MHFLLCCSLFGCVIGRPFAGPGYDDDEGIVLQGVGETVLVALTHGFMNPHCRDVFDEKNEEVWAFLQSRPGYIGGSIGKKLFGDEIWTISVWKDAASLEAFVNSQIHLDAIDSLQNPDIIKNHV